MKKFRYRLEPILRLKAHKEKEEQKIHAAAVKKIVDQKNCLAAIDGDRKANQSHLRNYLTGPVSLFRLSTYSRYFLKLKKDELTGNELLKAFQKNAEEKRLKLVEATKQRKIYEKIKERRHEEYIKDYELISQKENDEIASQSLQHKKSSCERQELHV